MIKYTARRHFTILGYKFQSLMFVCQIFSYLISYHLSIRPYIMCTTLPTGYKSSGTEGAPSHWSFQTLQKFCGSKDTRIHGIIVPITCNNVPLLTLSLTDNTISTCRRSPRYFITTICTMSMKPRLPVPQYSPVSLEYNASQHTLSTHSYWLAAVYPLSLSTHFHYENQAG